MVGETRLLHGWRGLTVGCWDGPVVRQRPTDEKEGELDGDESAGDVDGEVVDPFALFQALSESGLVCGRAVAGTDGVRDTSVDDEHAGLHRPDGEDKRMLRHKHPFATLDSLRFDSRREVPDVVLVHQIGPSPRRNLIEGHT